MGFARRGGVLGLFKRLIFVIIMLGGQHRQCYVGEMFDEKVEIISAELHKKLVTTLA